MNRFYGTIRSYTGPALASTTVTVYSNAAGTTAATLYNSVGAGIANPTTTSGRGIIDVYATPARLWFKVAGDTLVQPLTRARGLSSDDIDPNAAAAPAGPGLYLVRDEDNGDMFHFVNEGGKVLGYPLHITNHGTGCGFGVGEGNTDGTGSTSGIGMIIDSWGHGRGGQVHLMVTSGAEAVGMEFCSEGANVTAALTRLIAYTGSLANLQEVWTNANYPTFSEQVRTFYVDAFGDLRFNTKKVSHVQVITPAACNTTVLHGAINLPDAGTTDVTAGMGTPSDTPAMYRNVSIVANAAGTVGNVVVTGLDWMGRKVVDTIALNGTTVVYGTIPMRAPLLNVNVPTKTHAGDTVSIGTGYRLGLYSPAATLTMLERAAAGATAFTMEALDGMATGTTSEGYAYSGVDTIPVAGDRIKFTYVSSYI